MGIGFIVRIPQPTIVEEAMVVGWGRWWEKREKEEEGNGGGAI